MEILVLVKRVPDTSEAELVVDGSGRALAADDLSYGTNEWDDFAVEEAVRLKEAHGGSVTAITLGDEDAQEVLRRALAMGADKGLHLEDDAFADLDPEGVARVLHAAAREGGYDLVLCGAVSSDAGAGQIGGRLAALLDVPFVALATKLDVEGAKATVQHEVEGGLERVVDLDLPAVISVQTGINEPRYVSIRGIRKVSSVEIPTRGAADLGIDAAAAHARTRVTALSAPPAGGTAEILEGDVDAAVATLVERLKERGAI